jgi:hypothetical protein
MNPIILTLGTIDIFAAIFFWIYGLFGIIPSSFIFLFAFFLLMKGVVFMIAKDFASIGDFVCSILMFLTIYVNMPDFIIILVSLFLLQKGIFSWF